MGIISEHKKRESELEDLLQKKQEELEEKENEIFKLRTHLAYMIRQKFGKKAEQYKDLNQLSLFEMQEVLAKNEPPQKPKESVVRRKPKRKPLSKDLPRREEIIEPTPLPEGAKKIGEEVTEKLEFTPGQFWVRRIIRPKYVVPVDKSIVIASLPSCAIDKAIAGASLIAHLTVSKYCDHIPFYRMVGILKRAGVTLAESTVNNWFQKIAVLLTPLYQELRQQTLLSRYMQADETTIMVMAGKASKVHRGYYWVYYSPRTGALFFDYNESRGQHVPQETLIDFKGVLQTDGYAGYESLKHRDKIIRLACMAHARRYFEKAKDEDPDGAKYVLGQMQRLYAIERHAEQLSTEERYKLRQEQSVEILDEIKTWLDDNAQKMLPQSLMGTAISYTLKLWDRLCAFTQCGTYRIDNNSIENKIRPIAIGRKNYLFAGSHEAAQRAAVMYSLFASCKINEVDPYKWLADVLDKIPDYKANEIADLLPANWGK